MLALKAQDSDDKIPQNALSDNATLDNEVSKGFDTKSVFGKLQNFEPRKLQDGICANGNGITMEPNFFDDVEYTLGQSGLAIDFDLEHLATWTDQDCGDRSIEFFWVDEEGE